MIPDTMPCRCGAPVELRGGLQRARRQEGGVCVDYAFLWAGGRCEACGFVLQYGHGGRRGDYQHCRRWYIDKEAEVFHRGPARRWPVGWGLRKANDER
jgi:hypothetical protein